MEKQYINEMSLDRSGPIGRSDQVGFDGKLPPFCEINPTKYELRCIQCLISLIYRQNILRPDTEAFLKFDLDNLFDVIRD